MNHLDDDAELYALGMLEPHEREAADEHLRTCDACARRVGRSEAVIAALADAGPARSARRIPWSRAAAAALVLVAGGLTQQNLALHAALDDDGRFYGAMLASHFAHAQFVAPGGPPIGAKVVYDQRGRWYRILAERGHSRLHVVLMAADGRETVVPQRFATRGDVDLLVVHSAGTLREIRLVDETGRVVGVATPHPSTGHPSTGSG